LLALALLDIDHVASVSCYCDLTFFHIYEFNFTTKTGFFNFLEFSVSHIIFGCGYLNGKQVLRLNLLVSKCAGALRARFGVNAPIVAGDARFSEIQRIFSKSV